MRPRNGRAECLQKTLAHLKSQLACEPTAGADSDRIDKGRLVSDCLAALGAQLLAVSGPVAY
jgi:hypothetical protein